MKKDNLQWTDVVTYCCQKAGCKSYIGDNDQLWLTKTEGSITVFITAASSSEHFVHFTIRMDSSSNPIHPSVPHEAGIAFYKWNNKTLPQKASLVLSNIKRAFIPQRKYLRTLTATSKQAVRKIHKTLLELSKVKDDDGLKPFTVTRSSSYNRGTISFVEKGVLTRVNILAKEGFVLFGSSEEILAPYPNRTTLASNWLDYPDSEVKNELKILLKSLRLGITQEQLQALKEEFQSL